jgi:CheY-like chemotaxis protein
MNTNKVLIVDDNDRYANNLKAYLDEKNIPNERALDAEEGYELFQKNAYHTVITDITMETQTSGLWLARTIFKSGYNGQIIIATTGFDFPGVMFLGKYLLPSFAGVGWMVPKVPLKKGIVEFHPTYLMFGKKPFGE